MTRRFAAAFILLGLTALSLPAAAEVDVRGEYLAPRSRLIQEERTANRTADANVIYPRWLFNTPEHNDFLPRMSNHDPQNQHPQQWDGQEWDPAGWNADWTPEKTLNRLFENRTFAKQYMGGSKHVHNKKFQAHIPVLEVGPTFYKLSDLDRRRSLKLLADYTDVFGKGYEMIELRDWRSHETIGSYTPKGMFLH